MTRGFAIITDDIDWAGAGVARLRSYGVDEIEMAEDRGRVKERFIEVMESLEEEDKLVVCSLEDICRGAEELLEVFLVWSRRRFVLVSLEENWLEECREALMGGGSKVLLSHILRFAGGVGGEAWKGKTSGGRKKLYAGRAA